MDVEKALEGLTEEQLLALLAKKRVGNGKKTPDNNFELRRDGDKLIVTIDLVNVNKVKAKRGKSLMIANTDFVGLAFDESGNAQCGVDKSQSTHWLKIALGESPQTGAVK